MRKVLGVVIILIGIALPILLHLLYLNMKVVYPELEGVVFLMTGLLGVIALTVGGLFLIIED